MKTAAGAAMLAAFCWTTAEAQPAEARMESHALATKPPDPERIGRWKSEMSAEDRAVYEELAGDLLADLGYELEGSPVAGVS